MLHECAELHVELRCRACIACNVAPVPIRHVEIDEVDEAQPREVLLLNAKCLFHTVGVALVDTRAARDAAPREDVADLADGDDLMPLPHERIHHRIARRVEGEVVTMCCTLVVRIAADVRPCNDASDTVLALHDLACHTAVAIETLDGNIGLVCRDLQHAVRRRVDDEPARLLLLAPVVVNDLRAGVGLVAEDFLPVARRREPLEDFRRESVRICWHGLLGDDACDFPVSDRRVLAARELPQPCKSTDGAVCGRTAADAVDVKEAELREVRRVQFRRCRQRCERVAAPVAEIRCIRCTPDAEAVEDNQKYAFDTSHCYLLLWLGDRCLQCNLDHLAERCLTLLCRGGGLVADEVVADGKECEGAYAELRRDEVECRCLHLQT